MTDEKEPFSLERVSKIAADVKGVKGKRELARALSGEILRLNITDLKRMSEAIEREADKLPSPYREKIHPYFLEQFFGRYFRALNMHNEGHIETLEGDIADKKLFADYCDMLAGLKSNGNGDGLGLEPSYGGYYHLISCFAMFVLDEPGHPVGTPFPGGFTVERRGDGYYCPIRDKEKDVPFSICNFCPARQSEQNR
jgi:uncharacterized protein (UPF0305 family)